VEGDQLAPAHQERGRTAIYARVSSADQRADLDHQVARAAAWATEHGHSVDQAVSEVGSALLVEHRDRFCRFGAEHVEAALAAQGCRLVVVDPSEVDDDLVREATELLTSLCARLYGRRSASNRAKRAIEVACGETAA